MKTVRPPAHIRDLIDAGYEYETYLRAKRFFEQHGIRCGYSTRRHEWYFQAIAGHGVAVVTTLWCGLGAFVDRLDEPSVTIQEFKMQVARACASVEPAGKVA